jgi:hypothetical protein
MDRKAEDALIEANTDTTLLVLSGEPLDEPPAEPAGRRRMIGR